MGKRGGLFLENEAKSYSKCVLNHGDVFLITWNYEAGHLKSDTGSIILHTLCGWWCLAVSLHRLVTLVVKVHSGK